MFYIIFYLSMMTLAHLVSIPIVQSTSLTIMDVFYDWSAYMVFSGVLCGVFLILRPLVKIKFNPNSPIYRVPKWEQNFYKKIHAEKLNKLVPDFSFLVHFKKSVDPAQLRSPEYYKKYVYENVCGSLLHWFSLICSPLFFFFIHKELYITVGLIGTFLIVSLDLMPVILQRSVRPKLVEIYNKLEKRENSHLQK